MHLLANAFVVGRVYRYCVTLWGRYATNGFFRVGFGIMWLDRVTKLILLLEEDQVVSAFLLLVHLLFAVKIDPL